MTNLQVGLPALHFVRNQQHIDWWKNFEQQVSC